MVQNFNHFELYVDQKALICAQALIDKKGTRVRVLHLKSLPQQTAWTERFVIASAHSRQHTQALAESVKQIMKLNGYPLLSEEGYSGSQWILLDFDDVVVHVFLDKTREDYQFDDLWSHALPMSIPVGCFIQPEIQLPA